MLLQLRDFMERERVASNQQMERAFHVSPSALQPMLEFWVAKGMIRRVSSGGVCKSACFKCDEQKPDYYEWINKDDV